MRPDFEYLIDRYLATLHRAAAATSHDTTRAELLRHRDRTNELLLSWRLHLRPEDLRERLRDELIEYQTAVRHERLSGVEIESVAHEFANLCQAAGLHLRQGQGPATQ